MELRRFLYLVTAVIIILLVAAVWFLPSDEDFRVENPFWNGTSALHAAQPLASLDDLPLAPGGTLILVPYLDFTPLELWQVEIFVLRGGRLVLADDYGHGNQVLAYLGLPARFSGEALLDPLVNGQNQRFPRIIHLASDPLTEAADSLVFNHATSLANVSAGEVIARSSSFSFLDADDNGQMDGEEATGPLPVISRHSLGAGQVILIADPSIFINSMGAADGNARFVRNIAATGGSLYIDQSHLSPSDLARSRELLVKIRGFLASPGGSAGLVLLALGLVLQPVWARRDEGEATPPQP